MSLVQSEQLEDLIYSPIPSLNMKIYVIANKKTTENRFIAIFRRSVLMTLLIQSDKAAILLQYIKDVIENKSNHVLKSSL